MTHSPYLGPYPSEPEPAPTHDGRPDEQAGGSRQGGPPPGTPRTVTLATDLDDGLNGRQITVTNRWAYVALVDGELLVYNTDRPDAVDLLNKVGHQGRRGWTEFYQDETDPDTYRCIGTGKWPAP